MHWRKRNRKWIWKQDFMRENVKMHFSVLVRWHDRVSRWHNRVRVSCKGWHDRVPWWRDRVSSAESQNLVLSCFCVLLSMSMDSKHLPLYNHFIIKLIVTSRYFIHVLLNNFLLWLIICNWLPSIIETISFLYINLVWKNNIIR